MKAGIRRIDIAAPRTSVISQLELLFRPLLWTFGSQPGPPQGLASLKARLTACFVIVIILATLFCKVVLFIHSLERGFEHASVRRVTSCIRLVCSTFIAAMLIRRSNEIIAFKFHLLSLFSRLPALDPSSIRLGKAKLIIWSTAAAVWLHICYSAFQGFLPDTDEDSLAQYFDELWFGLDAKRYLSPFAGRCLWSVENFTYVVTANAVVYGSSMFYVVACFLLKARLRDFRLAVERQRWKHGQSTTALPTVTPKDLLDLQHLHEVLIRAAQKLEDIFAPIIFCSYVSCLMNVATGLYNFFDRNLLYFTGAPEKIHWFRLVIVYLNFGLAVWFFLLLSAAASLVNEEPSLTLPVIEKMILDVDELSVAFSFRASFLLARFSRPFVQLTAWKVFIISRSFVFTVVGAIVTYGVIILQFLHLGTESLHTT